MSTKQISALDLNVLQEICKQLKAEDRTALEAQIGTAAIRSRENTGAGFFTHFDVGRDPTNKVQEDHKNCYVRATFHGLKGGLGFILWLQDGYLDCLEGYTEDLESTVGVDLTALPFELTT